MRKRLRPRKTWKTRKLHDILEKQTKVITVKTRTFIFANVDIALRTYNSLGSSTNIRYSYVYGSNIRYGHDYDVDIRYCYGTNIRYSHVNDTDITAMRDDHVYGMDMYAERIRTYGFAELWYVECAV